MAGRGLPSPQQGRFLERAAEDQARCPDSEEDCDGDVELELMMDYPGMPASAPAPDASYVSDVELEKRGNPCDAKEERPGCPGSAVNPVD